MLQAEKVKDKAVNKDKKADEKALDLSGAPTAQAAKQESNSAGIQRRGTQIQEKSGALDAEEKEVEEEDTFGKGALDQNMALIRRKTIAIKSDNVSDVLMSNIGAISESVANFQKMAEQSGENDIALQFQN